MTEENFNEPVTKRLKILEADEIEAIYGLPVFNNEDRAFFFSLSPPERALLSQLHGHRSQIYYILQLGYFKARQQFYIFDLQQVARDASYVQRNYFPDFEMRDLDISKVTRLKQQRLILELMHYRPAGAEDWQQLRKKALEVARISGRPIYMFRELMAYLTQQRLIAPGYTVMQEMIGEVLQREKERLIAIGSSQLNADAVSALNQLLANPHGLYEITRLCIASKPVGEN